MLQFADIHKLPHNQVGGGAAPHVLDNCRHHALVPFHLHRPAVARDQPRQVGAAIHHHAPPVQVRDAGCHLLFTQHSE